LQTNVLPVLHSLVWALSLVGVAMVIAAVLVN
jgi:uncharacterized MAPEG superfamily protein